MALQPTTLASAENWPVERLLMIVKPETPDKPEILAFLAATDERSASLFGSTDCVPWWKLTKTVKVSDLHFCFLILFSPG